MRKKRVPAWLVVSLGMFAAVLVPPCAAEDAEPDRAGQANGRQLWQDFQETYAKYSYAPLGAAELDLKARAALLKSLGARYRSWPVDKATTLPELVESIHRHDASLATFDLVERALSVLLGEIDRFGLYQPGSEISQMEEALRQSGGQIAMTVERDDAGRLLCYPDPDGPAAEAGVNYGAELLEVDGVSMERKALAAVKLAVMGPSPSVSIKIRQPQGKIETVSIKRGGEPLPAVSVKKGPAGVTVRIRKFDKGCAKRIKDELTPLLPIQRMSLDLRGNPGGLRDEAMLVASLFFPEQTVLGRLKDGAGERDVLDGNPVFCEPGNVQILLDRRSASGAEFLAACLRDKLADKVKIYGEASYGKSHSTVRVPLYGGGAMTVSESLMMTASGTSWDKEGIKPDVEQKRK